MLRESIFRKALLIDQPKKTFGQILIKWKRYVYYKVNFLVMGRLTAKNQESGRLAFNSPEIFQAQRCFTEITIISDFPQSKLMQQAVLN